MAKKKMEIVEEQEIIEEQSTFNEDFFQASIDDENVEVQIDCEEINPVEGIGSLYTPRLASPSISDRYWIKTSYNGLNECILIDGSNGSCLPNCVGYAWGRFYEILGTKPTLSKSNAENWYNTNDGYERGQSPKLGAVICWRKGEAGNGNDGAGHVAIVERINADGSILTSNSGYGSSRFWLQTVRAPYNIGANYYFQGFIYNPGVIDEPVVAEKTTKSVDLLAQEVIQGLWGNGEERKNKLISAGADYTSVQNKVNELLAPKVVPIRELAIGDKVRIIGTGNGSSYGSSNTAYGIGWEREILNIWGGRAYPYQVGIKGVGTTGFYAASALNRL